MLKYMKKYWIFAILAAGFMIAEVYIDMLQPKLMARIVDEGILGLNNNGTPDLSLITTTGIRMILVVLLGGICGALSGVTGNICSQGCTCTICILWRLCDNGHPSSTVYQKIQL